MNNLNIVPKEWRLAKPELITFDNFQFVEASGEYRSELPIEFFSHQFMDINPKSLDDIMELVTIWGIPLHPSRYPLAYGGYLSSLITKPAIRLTDRYRFIWDIERYSATSLDEIIATVIDLQFEIREMFEYLKGNISEYFPSVINFGLISPVKIASFNHAIRYPSHEYNLTNAISNQILDTVADDREWKICSRPDCGRIYKRFQGHSKPKTSKRASDSKYCSVRCQNTQGQRNRRAAIKAKSRN